MTLTEPSEEEKTTKEIKDKLAQIKMIQSECKDASPIEQQCINTVRVLSADMIQKANSGHPGAPMGCAPMAHVLYDRIMKYSPSNPQWWDRDRFVLSNGHSCALLYSIMHLTGYALSMEDIKQFRQLGSITPGHPENFLTPGVEVCTGPLGQGISNAVGLALAERHLGAKYNREGFPVVDHFTYVICGDGCLQEGISGETGSLAGHWGLGKLIVLYDDNRITIDGSTDLAFTEDVNMRYQAYGWQVLSVGGEGADGGDVAGIEAAVRAAQLETLRPTLIRVRTVIGFGSCNQGSEATHGAPLGSADLQTVKQKFGFDPSQSFAVPEEVRDHYVRKRAEGAAAEHEWEVLFAAYALQYPELAQELQRRMSGELPVELLVDSPSSTSDGSSGKSKRVVNLATLPSYDAAQEKKAAATRNRSGEVLNFVSELMPELMGGSADLTGSNCANMTCSTDFQKGSPLGRNLRFGVREHGMVAICNGLFAHGGVRPYCATFLNFIGYALGAVRVTALSKFGVLFIMTHDSIGLGEDGPTHQPVELLDSLRAVPNLLTFRPCDGNEVSGCYALALQHTRTPSVVSLSRQGTPTVLGSSAAAVRQGAYVIRELRSAGAGAQEGELSYPTLTLVSTGTELAITISAAEDLFHSLCAQQLSSSTSSTSAASADAPPVPPASLGVPPASLGVPPGGSVWVRVVSMPCTELFDAQPVDYQLSVFLPGSPVMSVEASGVLGWRRYAHAPFGIDDCYGKSAPASALNQYFGFTRENLSIRAAEVVDFYRTPVAGTPSVLVHPFAPSLLNVPRFPKSSCRSSYLY